MYRETTLKTKQRLGRVSHGMDGGRVKTFSFKLGRKKEARGNKRFRLLRRVGTTIVGIDTTTLILTQRGLGPLSALAAGPALGGQTKTRSVSRFGLAVSRGTSVRIRFGSPFSSKVVVCGLSLTINETLKWLASLPILMQESFWW